MHSLLSVLAACLKLEIDFQLLPTLHKSLKGGISRCIQCLPSKREQALHAFKVGLRGSMRRGASITDWVQMLLKLQECGDSQNSTLLKPRP